MKTIPTFCLLAVLGLVFAQPIPTTFAEDKPAETLTREEQQTIRKIVFEGIATETIYPDPKLSRFPKRILSIDKNLIAIYKKKKVATLEYLLEIVKVGRAVDSFTAAALAQNLEAPEKSVGNFYASIDLEDYDDPKKDPMASRENEIHQLKKLIETFKKK